MLGKKEMDLLFDLLLDDNIITDWRNFEWRSPRWVRRGVKRTNMSSNQSTRTKYRAICYQRGIKDLHQRLIFLQEAKEQAHKRWADMIAAIAARQLGGLDVTVQTSVSSEMVPISFGDILNPQMFIKSDSDRYDVTRRD